MIWNIFLQLGFIFSSIQLLSQALPRLDWSTFQGGNAGDGVRDIAIDRQGFIYTVGTTSSTTGVASTGAFQSGLNGSSDVILAKYDRNGMKIWSTYFGGNGEENGQGIIVDKDGNIIICGNTNSTTGLASGSVQNTLAGGESDIFIAKFTADGQSSWATYYGGSKNDQANDVAVDGQNNIVITGWSFSENGIFRNGFDSTQAGGNEWGGDMIVAKFSTSGILIWGTYYGDVRDELGLQIGVDQLDNVFVTGWTTSKVNFATSGSYQSSPGDLADAFLIKFDASGRRQWCTYLGGEGEDFGDAMVILRNGEVVIGGSTNSTRNITFGTNSLQTNSGGQYDFFLSKFSNNGNPLWSTYYGGNEDDWFYGLFEGSDNAIYGTGFSKTRNGLATMNAHQTTNEGDFDAICFKLTPGGQLAWSTYFGDNNEEKSYGVVVNNINEVFIAGNTASNSGISTTNGFQQNFGGGIQDGFLAKFSPCDTNFLTVNANDTVCSGGNILFTASGGDIYTWMGPTGFNSSSANPMISNVTPLNSGVYKVVARTLAGCLDSQNINVLVHPRPLLLISSNGPVCEGETTLLQSTFTGQIVWSGPQGFSSQLQNPSITNTNFNQAGKYIATTTNLITGCQNTDSLNLGVLSAPTLTLNIDSFSMCSGDTFLLRASGAFSYVWNGPQNLNSSTSTISINNINAPGRYNVTLTARSLNGCSLRRDIPFTVNNKPVLTISGPDTACVGQNVTLNLSTNIGSAIWSGSSSNSLNFTLSRDTTLKAIAISVACRDSLFKSIIVKPNPTLIIEPGDTGINNGTTLQLNATGQGTITWTNNSALSCVNCNNPRLSPTQSTRICASSNLNGCIAERCINIEVKEKCSVILPNIIATNTTDNSIWCSPKLDCLSSQELFVFDRWGNLMYQSSGEEVCWTQEEKNISSGVYSFKLILLSNDGNKSIILGTITLVR